MNKPYLITQFYFLFFTLILFNSCNGQNNRSVQNDSLLGSKHAKVFKSQPTKNGDAENVRSGILDKNGNLWFGTTGHGVFKYDGTLFTLYTQKDGLGGNRVVALCEDRNGNILLGTEKGLYFFDGESIGEYVKNDELRKRSISTLYLDNKDQIWIGTHHSGMYVYDGKTLTSLQSDNKVNNDFNLTLNGISRIIEDQKGNIWLTSWAIADEGIIEFTGDSLIKQSKVHGLTDSLYYSAFEDSNGRIWFGSRKNGLYYLENEAFTQVTDKEGPPTTDCISDILEDNDGTLWFVTDQHGVYSYNGKSFVNYTTEDGLINNSVFTVVEDNIGNLWFGTRNVGLSRYDGKSFVNFSE